MEWAEIVVCRAGNRGGKGIKIGLSSGQARGESGRVQAAFATGFFGWATGAFGFEVFPAFALFARIVTHARFAAARRSSVVMDRAAFFAAAFLIDASFVSLMSCLAFWAFGPISGLATACK